MTVLPFWRDTHACGKRRRLLGAPRGEAHNASELPSSGNGCGDRARVAVHLSEVEALRSLASENPPATIVTRAPRLSIETLSASQ